MINGVKVIKTIAYSEFNTTGVAVCITISLITLLCYLWYVTHSFKKEDVFTQILTTIFAAILFVLFLIGAHNNADRTSHYKYVVRVTQRADLMQLTKEYRILKHNKDNTYIIKERDDSDD
jgi:hypothetical protein